MCICVHVFLIELKLVYVKCLLSYLANHLAAIPRRNTKELSQILTDNLTVLHCFPG